MTSEETNPICYGISAITPEQLSSLPSKLPEPLGCVEFPGDVLDNAFACQKLSAMSRNGIILCGRDFIPPEIADLIPEENGKLKSELEQHFLHRCTQGASIGMKQLSITFDLLMALDNPEYRRLLTVFLRRFAGVIMPLEQTLYLVCRIPGTSGEGRWEEILRFRRDLMTFNIDLLLELHPHEPNATEAFNAALDVFRFHDDCRRVCYDAAVGNVLTPGALKKCSVTLSRELERKRLIFLSPGPGKFDTQKLNELAAVAAGETAP